MKRRTAGFVRRQGRDRHVVVGHRPHRPPRASVRRRADRGVYPQLTGTTTTTTLGTLWVVGRRRHRRGGKGIRVPTARPGVHHLCRSWSTILLLPVLGNRVRPVWTSSPSLRMSCSLLCSLPAVLVDPVASREARGVLARGPGQERRRVTSSTGVLGFATTAAETEKSAGSAALLSGGPVPLVHLMDVVLLSS
ncbi:uncharacterized protein B0T15DRAFT_35216 [Chaetomium strumarium]|uniref:Uncharacterized protein n=1 Tax=Chaetomium strumarium TaxID=1170767 RepID=A0AAJ0H2L9_9PEZI|nr:hypothetical protein B0T15DRAFT_35216 [Chaetomium strumarium]